MTTNGSVVFVNSIEVDQSKQDELIKVLTEGAEKVIRHRPGLESLTLLASKDGTRVISYALWHSADDARATQIDPAAQEYAKRAAELGRPSPSVYAVVAQYQG